MIFPDFTNATTPFYYYDTVLLRRTIAEAKAQAGDIRIHYAIKANSNPHLLKIIAGEGLGADCVSAGEIELALAAGFKPQDIMFAGVGKSDAEICLALERGIAALNVESIEELQVVAELAAMRGTVAPVALRINPDIDAHTHHYITTGLEENKFGIDMQLIPEAMKIIGDNASLKLKGLHFHIGSQIEVFEPFEILCQRIAGIVGRFEKAGYGDLDINVGGGLGIDYAQPDRNPIPDFARYFGTFRRGLDLPGSHTVHCELGRAIVAQCGSLISRVLYVKNGIGKKFVIADAGMTELIRPALYQASHKIENISAKTGDTETYDVVGPVCESSDCFAADLELPLTKRGDIIAIRSAGAYGEAMSSNYNCRHLNPAVFSE